MNDAEIKSLSNRPFEAGEKVEHTGTYQVTHDPAHCEPRLVFFASGDVFPNCESCTNPAYHLLTAVDSSGTSKTRCFFMTVEENFRNEFGRDLTFEEHWFFDLAERAVVTAELDSGRKPKP